MGLRVLFLDMNAYFASVEQQLRPELRGVPVAVAALDVDSTCCIAASYEAKRLGVRTGTPVWQARRLPGMTVVEARPMEYVRVHHQIVAAVESCLPVDAIYSVDEMACRLGTGQTDPTAAAKLGNRVKRAVKDQVGQYLRCSVGLAPNRLLAKVASDLQKPDGLSIITEQDLPDILYPLRLDDLPGVGPRMLARLNTAGVRSIEDLYRRSEAELKAVWGGVVGQRWWHWLRGADLPEPPTRRSTVGHSHVLPPELRTDAGAEAVLVRLIHKAAVRLRDINYWARHLSVYVSYTYREEGWRASVPLGECQDTQTMLEAFAAVWPHRPAGPGRPTQVAVTLYNLTARPSATLPLFASERRRTALSRVLDEVNRRFGPDTLYFGGMHVGPAADGRPAGALDAAPTRIAFGQIPGLLAGDHSAATPPIMSPVAPDATKERTGHT